jgi:hypothetical protein
MRYIHRALEGELRRAIRAFPAVILTGPRRSGKTTLLRRMFPKANYVLLEDPDLVSRFRADPAGFVAGLEPPVILDEIQNVPEILNYLRARIDLRTGRRKGPWLVTGSQEAGLMRGVTESMAGRAAVLYLLPLSIQEDGRVSMFRGGFPEAIARPSAMQLWFSSYVATYLERDVRTVTMVRDLAAYRRFMALLAGRSGQVLNRSELSAALGVSVPTVSEWIGILETTGQVLLAPPFYENFGKRLMKSPKVYFTDSGLLCHLLNIETEQELARSPFLGAIFEGLVASEIAKSQINSGRRRELYWFRDQQGLEVDFVVPGPSRALTLFEAKATSSPKPAMAGPLRRLAAAAAPSRVRAYVVHLARRGALAAEVLSPGVKAIPVGRLCRVLEERA